jgi:hypothetical protein
MTGEANTMREINFTVGGRGVRQAARCARQLEAEHTELLPTRARLFSLVLGCTLALVIAGAPVSAAAPGSAAEPPPRSGTLQLVREMPTRELGVERPATLAWDGRSHALLVRKDGRVVRLGTDGTKRGRTLTGQPAPRPFGSTTVDAWTDRSGVLFGLASGALLRYVDGKLTQTPIRGAAGHDLRGLTGWPGTHLLWTFDQDRGLLLGLTQSGRVARYLDARELGVSNVTGIAVAPSADRTDDPASRHVYLADAGAGATLGRIVEASLASEATTALAVTGTLVHSVPTSALSPPSPDPSGVAYLPGIDQLFIADGEVDEMSIFAGSNLFATTRAGSVTTTGVSKPWSDEPVGVGYNPGNNHLFVSDDDQKEVFEVTIGADGRFGTSDDTVTHFDTNAGGNTDPEGVDYDTATGSIWTADGVNTQVFRYQPGPDGQFGTSDDVRNNFDVGVYGARDPEGMGYDPVRDTILIVDDGSETIYEMDKTGALLNTISIAGHDVTAAAGLAVAPGSSNATQRNYYVVARGLDNDSHPTENDGMLYEFSATLPPTGTTTNQAPIVNAGPDQTAIFPNAALLDGTASDDGRPTPPGGVTTTWEKVTGFGTVTFGNPSSVDTTAQFSAEGTYVLRLTANDGQSSVADEITVTVVAHVTGALTKSVVAVGERTRFTGTVSPAEAGQPVVLQRRKGGTWVKVRTKHLEAGHSTYRFSIRRDDSGRYRYRTRVPAYASTPSAAFGGPAEGLLLRVYRAKIAAVHHRGDEFVVIANKGAVPMNIDGWLLINKRTEERRTLPDLVVLPGHVVRIHSGAGTSDKNDLYLDRTVMWGKHATALLRNDRSVLLDRFRY